MSLCDASIIVTQVFVLLTFMKKPDSGGAAVEETSDTLQPLLDQDHHQLGSSFTIICIVFIVKPKIK